MYPLQRSRKTFIVMLILGFLGSIFLSTWKSSIKSAQAFFSPEDRNLQNISIIRQDGLGSVIEEAVVQEPVAELPSAGSGIEGELSVPIVLSPATTPVPLASIGRGAPLAPLAVESGFVLEASVAGRNDDAEQRVSDGRMYLTSSDLELVNDPGVTKGIQSVGLRFSNINIPKQSTILSAYIEFQVAEVSVEATSLTLRGQAADNAELFSRSNFNVSSRMKTSASVSWNNIGSWTSVGARVQSPDLSGVIQEIVNRGGWADGNSLAIIMEGTGRRIAAAYEASSLSPALLHIVYLPLIATATPTPPPTQPPPGDDPQPMGQSGNWILKFRDEFNSPSLDTSKWRTCFWWADTTCTIESNHEMQLYNPEDVLVENGMLRLRSQQRDMVAWNGVTYHYTSGMVMTGGRSGQIPPSFTFVYGFAEALVKIPAGQGLWPAFWTLSADYSWPPEIDIMEILGHETDVYHMNYHYVGGDAGTRWTGPDFSAGWHVLGLDWQADAIRWFVDGVERWSFTDASQIINEPSYLLLNLAVGGDWPGPPDGSTVFPNYYDIDYVRVWQHP